MTCTLMGLTKKRELAVRVEALDSLILFAETVRTEILCGRRTLSSIIEDFNGKNVFFDLLAKSDVFPISSRYETVKDILNSRFCLKNDWLISVDTMFRVLGKTDGDDQCNMLENVIFDLKEKRKLAYTELTGLGSVYVKAGLAVGAFSVIICV